MQLALSKLIVAARSRAQALTPTVVSVQRGATVARRNVLNAVDTVLDLPSRATNADASVHGPPVQGIVSAASGGDAQLVRRMSFFAKVSGPVRIPWPCTISYRCTRTQMADAMGVPARYCLRFYCTLSMEIETPHSSGAARQDPLLCTV